MEVIEPPDFEPGVASAAKLAAESVEVIEPPDFEPGVASAAKLAAESDATLEASAGTRDTAALESIAPDGPSGAAGSGNRVSAQGAVYTWNDGDRTLQAQLQTDLVVLDDGAITKQDDIVTEAVGGRIVNRGAAGAADAPAGQPVFLSTSGTLMTLPGGVALVLDPEWGTAETDAFFADNDISLDRVSELSYATNGFFVETDPGFASLELANALAGQTGVELSSPNWWRERTTR